MNGKRGLIFWLTVMLIFPVLTLAQAKNGPQQPGPSLDQVKKLFKDGQFDEALKIVTELLAQSPDNAEFHTWKGHVLGRLAQGNPLQMMKYGPAAMQEYETALSIDPNNAGAHFGRGVGRLMAPFGFGGDVDGAIQDLEFACAKAPFPESWFYLGEAYKRKGMNDKAKEAYKKALALRPNYPEAAKALADLGEKSGLSL